MQARLQSLEEQQDVEVSASSAGVGAIAWRGQTSVVSAERVRVALGQALELSKQVTCPLAALSFLHTCAIRGACAMMSVDPFGCASTEASSHLNLFAQDTEVI